METKTETKEALPKELMIIDTLATLFEDSFEVAVADVLAKLEFGKIEELEAFLAENPLYELDSKKEFLRKKQLVQLKMLLLQSPVEVPTTLAELTEIFKKTIKVIPYLRFNKFQGHLIVFEELIEKHPELINSEIEIKDDLKIKIVQPDIAHKKAFSKEHGKHVEGILKKRLGKNVKYLIDGLVSNRSGIYLGYQKFKSLNEIKSYFGNLLKSSKDGEPIDNPAAGHLKELLKFHEKGEEKLKNIDHFESGLHPEFPTTRCFLIVKKDGTKEDFSFLKCIKTISGIVNSS